MLNKDSKEECCGGHCGCSDTVSEPISNNVISLEKIINTDKIEDNSVLLFRIKQLDNNTKNAIEQIMSLFGDALSKKNCSFLVMTKDSDIELVSEKQMNTAGWVRAKEKSLIIH